MEGMDAGVMDTPEVDSPEIESPEVETESPELESAEVPEAESEGAESASSDPFTTKFSREYRQWLNSQKITDPNAAKFVKQARDDYGRVFAMQQLGGIDGIREKLSLLDSLAIGDAKGAEAITAMQESLREAEEVDSLIASGDPRALDTMGPDFNEGLAKLAPAYLDRLSQSSPEAYQSAILPHVVGMLQQTPVLEQFNYLVDVLNGKYGKLDDQTKLERTYDALKQMSEGFNALGQKATQAKAPAQPDQQRTQFENERTKFEQERQDHYWKTNIQSVTDPHANSKFEEFYKPLAPRLKLDDAAKADLRNSWIQGVTRALNNDQDYVRQIKLFRAQKNPDANVVANFVKNAINKHGKNIFDANTNTRYGAFLAGKPKTQATTRKGASKPQPAAGPNVEIRTVKPPMSEIDHRNTPLEWTASTYPGGPKYRLYSGKIVQVRRVV